MMVATPLRCRECRGRVGPRLRRFVLRFALVAPLLFAPACSGPRRPEPIFPPVQPPLVWPPPPDPPRIQWIGQLSTEADLRTQKTAWQSFSETVAGRPPIRGLATPVGVAVRPSARDSGSPTARSQAESSPTPAAADDRRTRTAEAQRLFIADPALGVVHLFDLASRQYAACTTAAGQPLLAPAACAIAPDGAAYVCDARAARVAPLDLPEPRASVRPSHAPLHADAPAHDWIGPPPDTFKRPVAIAVLAPSGGPTTRAADSSARLYIIDAAACRCVILDERGQELSRFGRFGSAPGEFNHPTAVAVHPRVGLVIADSLNFRIQRFSPEGQFISKFGQRGDGAGDFALPKAVAIDQAGRIFVVDAQFENVQVFTPDGRLLLAFGEEGRGPGQFWLPSGAVIDQNDCLWIADTYNRRMQVFQVLPDPPVAGRAGPGSP